jgi:hypothetical protein
MENQHRLIAGYRELTPEEIALINDIKQNGNELGALLDLLEQNHAIDKRWLAIARTDLQRGLMALVRAIARPQGFC